MVGTDAKQQRRVHASGTVGDGRVGDGIAVHVPCTQDASAIMNRFSKSTGAVLGVRFGRVAHFMIGTDGFAEIADPSSEVSGDWLIRSGVSRRAVGGESV